MYQTAGAHEGFANIRVVGVGGGGGNAVNRMIEENILGVEFVAINTDAQALMNCDASKRVRVGEQSTRGLGSGGDPEVGRIAAEESVEDLREVLKGSDMVFITAGMGGGTGTGGAPIVANVARESGALTIGVVTKPFTFEGSRRALVSESGISALKEHVDTLIVIPNDRLLDMADKRTSLSESFKMADEVLRQGIQGISELITVPGMINLDFADVKAIMSVGGAALMAVGTGEGEDAAIQAAEAAINNNLLEISIDGARGILFNVTGGPDMSLHAVNQAAAIIRNTAHPDVNLIFGTVVDETMRDKVRVTVIATGFERGVPRRELSSLRSRSQSTPSIFSQTKEDTKEQPKVASLMSSDSSASSSMSSDNKPSIFSRSVREMDSNDLDLPTFLRHR
ncbi:MAG: cell division protein FtsZ [Chloroflexota bacterium]